MVLEQPTKNFSTNTQKETKEALHIWADIDEHLQFADRIIHNSDLPDQVRTPLLQQIQHIRSRQTDPKMYLAVVGEFSTGKSTFINALLHEELLKTSIDVTTAASTQIKYGTHLDLEVSFRHPKNTLSYTQNRPQLWMRINMLSHYIHGDNNDIHTYIHAVTANNQVTAHVESVVIHHPTAFLANGVVIIDTPGINAEHETHRQVTQQIVQHKADAAVIIIPAPVPLAQTLTTFLMESLRPYIHRCLFVVTQMDKIQEREQKRLLDNIRARLRKVLETDQAIVLYESAPQVVLDMLQKQAIAPGLEHWSSKFGELEQTLWNRLRQERALSITESLLRLMAALFQELDKRLQERQLNYRTRQAAIKQETIQDISSFTEQQQQTYQNKIRTTVASERWDIERYSTECNDQTKNSLQEAIFSVTSASDLKTIMETTVKREMQNASDDVQQRLQRCLENLEYTTTQASRSFDERFAQEYRKLQALAGTVSLSQVQKHSNNLAVNTSNVFYSADKINRELDDTVGKLGWGGAAIGAAIGTALLPGLGTVAGLLVGPLLVGLFGPSLQERKAQVWDAVRPALDSSFQTMLTQCHTVLDRYESEVRNAFNQRIRRYMQEYKAVVDTMIQQQQQQLVQIQRLQLTTESNQKEIERRRNSLKQKLSYLAQKNI